MQEVRKECESLMTDYQACAEQRYEAETECDKYKNHYKTALKEINQRVKRIKVHKPVQYTTPP